MGEVRILAVEPSVDELAVGDVHPSDESIADLLREIGRNDPGRRLDLVVGPVAPYTHPSPTVLRLRDGVVSWTAIDWSVERDVLKYGPADRAPDVPVGEAFGEVDADLIHVFEEVALAPAYWREDDYGDELVLPFAYHDAERALDAFVRLAKNPGLTVDSLAVTIEVAQRRYGAFFDRHGVLLQPLSPWVDDPELRALVRRALPEPGKALGRRLDGRDMSPIDAASPLTSGPARARADAAFELAFDRVSNGGVFELVPRRERAVIDALVAAARSEANAGTEYDDLRGKLYELAADLLPGPEEVARLLVEALARETDGVRQSLYVRLSKTDHDLAHRALVRGFKDERGLVRSTIAEVLWRQERTLEILVRDELVPSWSTDAKWGKRIVRLLGEEYIPIPRAWLADAPPSLLSAIGARIQD